ncbi:putative adaptor protein [Citrobacter phage CVT22]|uniref:Adaptor protein n=1 Tax=Citrobacter phage CVT22 TaxID=1622234 RepID=A0A0R6CQ63_9CAUD|nr:tail protein [Citrobacter phage CVT22]AJT60714.1 putative adaptor protein [Citrobacter phage CVT22]
MAKMSLLEITQDILNDLDADFVNSINDTVESQQVAQIVKSTFFALMHRRNWRSNKQLLKLTASGDDALPTHMYLPENLSELTLINYNCQQAGQTRKFYKNIKFIYPDEFLRRQNMLNDAADNVDVIQDPTGVELIIRNDVPPTYWTTFDDNAIVFDSYDSELDDTLQSHKVQAFGYLTPSWIHLDSAIPDIPEEDFTLLLEEAKSRASIKIRQVADQKAEQEAQRQDRWLSRKQWRAQGGVRYPSYGRKGRK